MKSHKAQRIRDSVHDLIEFGSDHFEHTLWEVIQTRPFQRLRRVKQLGFSDLVYPGATHSRFAHSVGVFHTARKLMDVIGKHTGKSLDTAKQPRALAASLLHDVGHGPFSHAFESVGKKLGLKMAAHERISDELIRNGEIADALRPMGSGFADDVAGIIRSESPSSIYDAVVSSQFDADRLDYMRRDRLMTGTRASGIDFEWLLANLEVGEISVGVDDAPVGTLNTFVIGPKAFRAAEAYVLALFQLYPTVYFHKATRCAEKIFCELLFIVIRLIQDGSSARVGLPEQHPIVRFARKSDDIETLLSLDDATIWGSLSMFADSEDQAISELAKRLRDRKLLQCVDIRERLMQKAGIAELASDSLKDAGDKLARVNEMCVAVRNRIDEWKSTQGDGGGLVLLDSVSREPYKKAETKGPLNQIRIRTNGGQNVDLAEQSRVVASSMIFQADRVYVSRNNANALSAIEDIIAKESTNGTP
jgi:uncharacterized protein